MSRDITLGGRMFSVPPLPLRINARAYPMARALTKAELVERLIAAGGSLDLTEAEMGDLLTLLFTCCQAAEPDLTREVFDELPATPVELFDAFLVARYQTGGWKPVEPGGDPEPGEGEGATSPPTSTSGASSQG